MNAFPVAVAVGTLLLVAADASRACGEALRGTTGRAENARYEIVFAAVPAPLAVDATMPEHRHGMNYRASVAPLRSGVWRADGLLFHMPGRWDLTFDVVAGGATQRVTSTMTVE